MKLPFPKGDDGKRMMISGNSTGRKELIHGRRESCLVGEHAIRRRDMVDKAVHFGEDVDLGRGDISNNLIDGHAIQSRTMVDEAVQFGNNMDLGSGDTSNNLVGGQTIQNLPEIDEGVQFKENMDAKSGEISNHFMDVRSNNDSFNGENRFDSYDFQPAHSSTPAPTEPSKTSTLWFSERTRSESEDDIEEMHDPEPDGTITGIKTLYKSTATTDNSPNSEKTDKNGNRSEVEQNDADNECIVQCLSYTMQCCDCVIS